MTKATGQRKESMNEDKIILTLIICVIAFVALISAIEAWRQVELAKAQVVKENNQ